MKNLQQILGLYLGQKAITTFSDVKAEIDVTYHFHSAVMEGKVTLGENGFLLLRPLSSMTEEEARGLCKDMEWEFSKMTDTEGEDCFLIYTKDGNIFFYETSIDTENASHYRSVQIPFSITPSLCAIGFDCFDLIGQGYAKDVTKQ